MAVEVATAAQTGGCCVTWVVSMAMQDARKGAKRKVGKLPTSAAAVKLNMYCAACVAGAFAPVLATPSILSCLAWSSA